MNHQTSHSTLRLRASVNSAKSNIQFQDGATSVRQNLLRNLQQFGRRTGQTLLGEDAVTTSLSHYGLLLGLRSPNCLECPFIPEACPKSEVHTTGWIPRWSPTLVLVARFSAYVWQSGRDAQFSLTYGRMCRYLSHPVYVG
jgi:hypothetical protein